MSDEFDSLDPNEPAGIVAELNRCRVLAAKIANELRNKRRGASLTPRPSQTFTQSLEHAADVLSTVKRAPAQGRQHHR
jgi:hypothetical protein